MGVLRRGTYIAAFGLLALIVIAAIWPRPDSEGLFGGSPAARGSEGVPASPPAIDLEAPTKTEMATFALG